MSAALLISVAAFSCLGGFLFGYDLGLIGGAILGIERDLVVGSGDVELIVGAFKLGACLGTLLGGALMLRYGRQKAIAMSSVFFTAGPLMMAAAPGAWLLVLGRLVCGVGTGSAAIVVPSYLAELSPAKHRGAMVQIYEVMLCLGVLAASLVDWALSGAGPHAWRAMVGLPAALGALLALAPLLLPESPRWLVQRGRLPDALRVLHAIEAGSLRAAAAAAASADGPVGTPAGTSNSLLSTHSQNGSTLSRTAISKSANQQHCQRVHAGSGSASGREQDTETGRLLAEVLSCSSSDTSMNGSVVQKSALQHHELKHGLCSTLKAYMPSGSSTGADHSTDPKQTVNGNTGGGGRPVYGVFERQARLHAQRAEDELLLLWSAVEKDRAAVKERREQQQRMHAMQPAIVQGISARPHPSPTRPAAGQAAFGSKDGASIGEHVLRVESHHQAPVPGRPAPREAVPVQGGWRRLWPWSAAAGYTSLPSAQGSSAPIQPSLPPPPVYEPGAEPSLLHTLACMCGDMVHVARGPEGRGLLLALGLAFFDQAIASSAVVNYAPMLVKDILARQHAGTSGPSSSKNSGSSTGRGASGSEAESLALLFTSLIGGAKLLGVLLAVCVVDRWGRRPLLLWGSAACAATLAAATASVAVASAQAFVGTLCAFIFFFSLSWAGLFWVVVSELFSMSAKSPAVSAATAMLFLTGAFTNVVFLSLVRVAGPYAFLVFSGLAVLGGVFVWVLLPETKGRTLLEIQAMLTSNHTTPRQADAHVQLPQWSAPHA